MMFLTMFLSMSVWASVSIVRLMPVNGELTMIGSGAPTEPGLELV